MRLFLELVSILLIMCTLINCSYHVNRRGNVLTDALVVYILMKCVYSKMKLYSLTVMYKGSDGQVKKLYSASDLASFGYFQRSRFAIITKLLHCLLCC